MNKKEKIILIVLFALSFLGLFFYTTIKLPPPNLPLTNPPLKREEKGGGQIAKTILEIEGQKYEREIIDEISVYDFMNNFRKEGVIDFTEKNYTGMGKFIESINGIKRDKDHSWIFYVNNQKAGIGVSKFKIKSGDIISWKYEENY